VFGEDEPLLVTVSVPVAAPAAVGANATMMEHAVAGARLAGHVLVCVNGPDTLMLLICRGRFPVFVSVIDCAALVVRMC